MVQEHFTCGENSNLKHANIFYLTVLVKVEVCNTVSNLKEFWVEGLTCYYLKVTWDRAERKMTRGGRRPEKKRWRAHKHLVSFTPQKASGIPSPRTVFQVSCSTSDTNARLCARTSWHAKRGSGQPRTA